MISATGAYVAGDGRANFLLARLALRRREFIT